jgi:hypothetical protein
VKETKYPTSIKESGLPAICTDCGEAITLPDFLSGIVEEDRDIGGGWVVDGVRQPFVVDSYSYVHKKCRESERNQGIRSKLRHWEKMLDEGRVTQDQFNEMLRHGGKEVQLSWLRSLARRGSKETKVNGR